MKLVRFPKALLNLNCKIMNRLPGAADMFLVPLILIGLGMVIIPKLELPI